MDDAMYKIKPIIWLHGTGYCLLGEYNIDMNIKGEYFFTYDFQENLDEGKSKLTYASKLDAITAADHHYKYRIKMGLLCVA